MLTVPREAVGGGPAALLGRRRGGRQPGLLHDVRGAGRTSWIRLPGRAGALQGRPARAQARGRAASANARRSSLRSGGTELHRGSARARATTSCRCPATGAATSVPIAVEVDGRTLRPSSASTLAPGPRRGRSTCFPHSHVDIGYSDPQPVVEQKQWKNLARRGGAGGDDGGQPARVALPLERRRPVVGRELPEAGDAPTSARQFADAVKQGSIGLQANYTNILTGPVHAGGTDALDRRRRAGCSADYGLPAGRSAMHTDIPGLELDGRLGAGARRRALLQQRPELHAVDCPTWAIASASTLHALGDRPFWWVSPSGQERLLFWMAGRGYSLVPRHERRARSRRTAARRCSTTCSTWQGQDYPYDMVQVRYTIGGDNGPVDPKLPDFVKAWNETFDDAATGDQHGRRAVRGVRAAVRRDAARARAAT